jgi:cell division protein FtsB
MAIEDRPPEPQKSEGGLPGVQPFKREVFIAEESQSEPSRFGRFMRRLLRWSVAVMIVFALGVGAMLFARVNPQEEQITQLQNTNQSLEDSMEDLQAEIDSLTPLLDENDELQKQLLEIEIHVEILKVIVDVNSAQLALTDDDLVSAKASLTGTDARLKSFEDSLSVDHRQTIEEMRDRLRLVLEELEEDAFAAKRDLEVLSNNLTALTRSLFRE